jgi:hypothetical protein
MRFALFEPHNSGKYTMLFEQDRKRLFPGNTFPPDKRDRVAHQALDDICDYLPWYYEFGVLGGKLEPYQACVKFVTPTMERHAALYGLFWVEEKDPHDKGKPVFYLMRNEMGGETPRVEAIDE